MLCIVKENACLSWLYCCFCSLSFKVPHKISDNVVCATSKASDQTAHMRSLIRAFASGLNIL